VVWAQAEQVDGVHGWVRLVLSDSEGPDTDLSLTHVQAESVGRALLQEGLAYGVEASTVDGESAALRIGQNEVTVAVKGGVPMVFVLEPAQARELGASMLARPVSYHVECPACCTQSWAQTRVDPYAGEARGETETWTCPKCGTSVVVNQLVGDGDDVWRVP
jgi:hypothetical protein